MESWFFFVIGNWFYIILANFEKDPMIILSFRSFVRAWPYSGMRETPLYIGNLGHGRIRSCVKQPIWIKAQWCRIIFSWIKVPTAYQVCYILRLSIRDEFVDSVVQVHCTNFSLEARVDLPNIFTWHITFDKIKKYILKILRY